MTALWMDDAACKGWDIDLFFPERKRPGMYADGVRICISCPVRVQCLEYAISNNIRHGLWGGMTGYERIAYAIEHGIIHRPYTDCGDMKGTTAGYHRERILNIPHCDACAKAYNSQAYQRNALRRARNHTEEV